MNGGERWVYRHDNPAGAFYSEAQSVSYGSDGRVYAAGFAARTNVGLNSVFTVVSLDANGNLEWVYRFDNPVTDSSDVAYDVVSGADGSVYAAGKTTGVGSGSDFRVVSLDPLGGIAEQGENGECRMTNSGPAVVRGVLSVSPKSTANGAQTDIGLYDTNGRKVLTLQPGPNNVSRLSPGVYFVREEQAQALAQAVRKVIVQR